MGVVCGLRCGGKAVHYYGNSYVLAGALGGRIVGLYQIIGTLADDTRVEVVGGGSVFTVNPATSGSVSPRCASQLDGTTAANVVVAANGGLSGYWVDGYGNLLSAAAFATVFAVV